MSFMDPDYRERLAKEAERARAECAKSGCSFSGIDVCIRCGKRDATPRIVAEYGSQRGVYRPDRRSIIVETKTVDAVGGVCWVFDSEHKGPLVELLVYGRKP